jgi:hypothetical protein
MGKAEVVDETRKAREEYAAKFRLLEASTLLHHRPPPEHSVDRADP